MTLCYINGAHCCCQPDEGVECPKLPEVLQLELAQLRKGAQRYEYLRSKVHSSWATAAGTHFLGDGVELLFPPPGVVYVTDDQGRALDKAVDAAVKLAEGL